MRTVLTCLFIGLLLGLGVTIVRAREPITPLTVSADMDSGIAWKKQEADY